jgi:hypothetical protein
LQTKINKKKSNDKSENEKKVKEEDEDPSEFFMKGKPYKEKYDGQRLTKLDYETKYSIVSEKVKLNFPGVTVGDDGHSIVRKGDYNRQK